jgi:hypothetical protein
MLKVVVAAAVPPPGIEREGKGTVAVLLPVPGRGSVFFGRAQHRGAGPYHTATATALTNSKKNMTLVQTCQSRDTRSAGCARGHL